MDLNWAVTQTGSWGGGARQVVGKRGCWQRVRKARQPFLLSHVLAPHTPCCPFPLAFPFQAGYDALFHWLAIGWKKKVGFCSLGNGVRGTEEDLIEHSISNTFNDSRYFPDTVIGTLYANFGESNE